MISVSVAFILALILALAATPIAVRVALWAGAVDHAGISSRKIHARSTPRMGGLAIVFAFFLPLVGLLIVDSGVGRIFAAQPNLVIGLFVGGLAIAALGVYDDIVGANAPQKFAVQFGVAIALYAMGFRIGLVSTPFDFNLTLGWLSMPVTVLWIAGVINALNLIDGLDGLAAGVALFASVTTLVLAVVSNNILMMLFMATLTGALLGFLYFNFNPAKIFLGDTGSMFLGFVIAVTSVQTSTKGTATVALLAPVLALGVPLMDTVLAMARRMLRGQSMFHADREHIHHRLLAMGLSHRRAVLTLYGVSLVFGAVAVLTVYAKGPTMAAMLVATVVALGFFMMKLGYLDLRRFRAVAKETASTRRFNLEARAAVRKLRKALRGAGSLDEEAWQEIGVVAEVLGAAKAVLRCVPVAGEARLQSLVWEPTPADVEGLLVTTHEVLAESARGRVVLELTWSGGRCELNTNMEAAVERIRALLSIEMPRLLESTDDLGERRSRRTN